MGRVVIAMPRQLYSRERPGTNGIGDWVGIRGGQDGWVYILQLDRLQLQCNKAHALCILDNWGYRHALRMCNNYSFTATVLQRKCLNVTSYVHSLSSLPLDHFQITSLVNTKMLLQCADLNTSTNMQLHVTFYHITCPFCLHFFFVLNQTGLLHDSAPKVMLAVQYWNTRFLRNVHINLPADTA
jgi:hypothetical protein